jgi:hypothetical protein
MVTEERRMRGNRSFRFRCIASLAILLALLVSPATFAAPRWRAYPTEIFVSEKFPALHGALHSGSRFCASRRRLLVYGARSGGGRLLAHGWSHRSGAWRVPLGKKLAQGHYYVIAPMRSSATLRIRCPAARSKSIPVR